MAAISSSSSTAAAAVATEHVDLDALLFNRVLNSKVMQRRATSSSSNSNRNGRTRTARCEGAAAGAEEPIDLDELIEESLGWEEAWS